ncbi:MAG: hypothetical protein WCW77_00605 [Patescibacteria group bacterium]|jgi:hypothetical protein
MLEQPSLPLPKTRDPEVQWIFDIIDRADREYKLKKEQEKYDIKKLH